MNREELQVLTDKVIGKKGIMRSSSWWVRRLLNAVIEYAEKYADDKVANVEIEVDDTLSESSDNPVRNSAVTSEILANEKVTAEALVALNNKVTEILTRLDKAGL